MTSGLTTPVPRRWTALLTVASLGLFTAFFGPLQVLLGRQAQELAPQDKELALGLVVGLGAGVSMVANPLFGALSDRTRWAAGRRLPWTAIGSLGGAASLVVLAVAPNLVVMALGWCLAQLTLNAMLAALMAAIPDQVPHRQRGTVGGWFGVGQTMGIVAGSGIAAAVGGLAAGYLVCAGFLLCATVPYLALRRDTVLTETPPRLRWRDFWISPRRHPDFGWAWLTRFLINTGNSIAIVYLLFFLQDAVGHPDPDDGVFVLTAVYAVTLLSTVVVAGIWSDRVGRRRVFVSGSGVVMAVAAALLAAWPAWPGALLAAAVLGLGFGAYTSVDIALMTEVLPAAADRGKDLGVINVASALPQVLAPVLAAPIVTHLGGYPVLYAVAAAFVLTGAVLVRRIRSVE
ncbi:MFS transporter [Actinophytocola xinjiangensis]|uniref:MFS transporter n=1 Tax=Actinophytocola xinjiangensis TaxID=485602 RepID=A0A7Z0WEB9_9PSEU|nr:MFS transporter [Actinophytocola xinjiangensis]OLF04736.1 MFS transporter [Actinophytocola xinjiangensis]